MLLVILTMTIYHLLDDVGDHDYIFISFDLYIHGSWDGNFNGFSENDKPDKWVII